MAKKFLNANKQNPKKNMKYDHDQSIANHVLLHDLNVGLRILSSHVSIYKLIKLCGFGTYLL